MKDADGNTVLCGAKRHHDGQPCQQPGVAPSGRCRFHGGKSTGPKRPNPEPGIKANTKFGIYSNVLTDDQKARWDDVAVGNVEFELKLARYQLERALLAQRTADELAAMDPSGGLELAEEILVKGGPATSKHEKKWIRRDYSADINRLMGRIESLERTRKELLKKDDVDDPDMEEEDTVIIRPDEPIPDKPIL